MTRRTLYTGGQVVSPVAPTATAMAIEDGLVVWVGDDASSATYADAAEQVVDLAGAVVTPAFVDAHTHLAQTGLADAGVDCRNARSRDEVLDRVATHVRTHSGEPLVIGRGWDERGWPDPAPPTRDELDRASGGAPVYLARIDVHSAVVSTALADRMGIVDELVGWDPAGRVERDAHHAARAAVDSLLTDRMRTDAIRSALRSAAAEGIGCLHELGAPHISPTSDFDRIRRLRAEQPLPVVLGYWGAPDAFDIAREYDLVGLAGDLCADGAIGSRTAALAADYDDCPGHHGHAYLDRAQVRDHVVTCTQAGLQAGFHVIGDSAVATVIDGLQAAAEQLGAAAVRQARHRLEHIEMIAPEQIPVLAELGVTGSVQPAFDAAWGHPGGLYEQRLGARAAGMNPFGSMARAGISLAFGSDSPVTPFDPWAAVQAAVWHHSDAERMSARSAFSAHTRGGWRAAGVDEAGVLTPGAPATFAVWAVEGNLAVQTPDARIAAWSTDPRAGVPGLPTLEPDGALPTCLATVVDGSTVFERSGVLA